MATRTTGKTPRRSEFSSDRARVRFLAVYDAAMARLWPDDRQEVDVPTAFGATRVHRTGRPDGVPFVLLPGAGGNALMWHRHVAALGALRPVFAVDPVGEPGGSVQDAPIADGRDTARWLGEVLAALHVDRAHFVGCSYGGWTALNQELHAPGPAATITLLDPAGFGAMTGRFLRWVILGGLAGLAPKPVRHRAAGWLRNATLRDDDIMGLVVATMAFRRRLPLPAPLTDDELRRITVPTLALLGEHSQAYDAAEVADRIRRVMPDARAEVVPGASHDVAVYDPALITGRIAAFVP